jgi:alkylation response protein AidB-like acyl-CoA dehydrogenase
MTDTFAELHDELRSVARDLLSQVPSGAGLDGRRLLETGWAGLEVPEAFDGAGATFAEQAVVLEELGRAASATPYLGPVVLAAGTLGALAPCAGRDELLRGVAAGEAAVAVALFDGGLDDVWPAPAFRLSRSGTDLQLEGSAAFVPDAAGADHLLVLADVEADVEGRSDAAGGGPGPVVVSVAPGAAGVEVLAQPVLDETRSLGTITAHAVAIDDASVWRFASDPARAAAGLADRAAVALACDCLGASEAMLAATVEYAGARHQFGRAIGSFQAVKHACADLLVQISVARQLVSAAVAAVAAGDDDAPVAASMAASYAGEAAVAVAGTAMQLHGGIGYTWESSVHLYLKRATLDRALFGSPQAHRRRLAARYR